MIIYDTIDIVCLVDQIIVKMKECSKFINDCTRNLKKFYLRIN